MTSNAESAGAGTFVRVRGLRKTYHMGESTIHALDGVDLDIAPRSFNVVMGPSGSGKSTLLHLLGGLDRPSGGEIEVGGQRVDLLNENELAVFRREIIGFVFQTFNLVPSMTALGNVAFPLRFAGVRGHERRERALEMLKRVGLADRAYHRPSELSGGQQQRVAIARALINDPRVILADEPTGNLDSASSAEIIQMLVDLHTAGRTVLVVTHDLRMRGLSTSTFYLLDGKLTDEQSYLAMSSLTIGRGAVQ